MRRGLAWSGVAVGTLALSIALIAPALTATSEAPAGLLTGPGWRSTVDVPGPVPRGPTADAAWLSAGSVPGRGTRWEQMARTALLDLHQLSRQSGAVAAGAATRWNYAWPRDTAFVAVALARTGHHDEALKALTFLQGVQLQDGGFEARYLLDGSGTPDSRARQSDGAGWALWAAWEVSRLSARQVVRPELHPGVPVQVRSEVRPDVPLEVRSGVRAGVPLEVRPGVRALLDDATRFALTVTDDGRQLPQASPDYWEVGVGRTSLGTVAPLLAGLQASQKLYDALGERALAERSRVAASRLRVVVGQRFDDGWERFGSGRGGNDGGLDAAVTFLMPPFASSPSPQVVKAWEHYQSDARRPAGGLAPGSRWKDDGISWTPETALVAYTAAMSDRPGTSAHWMDWLDAHRPIGGSLPEKVLATGAPAGPAPLAWTAALVVLTTARLETQK